MDERGQLSADFIFAFFLFLIIATAVVGVASNNIGIAQTSDFSKAKVLADDISRTIDAVYTNGMGQYAILKLPTDFLYRVEISSSSVSVFYNNSTSTVATSNIIPVGYIVPQTMSPGQIYNVTNNQGTITFTKLS